MVHSTPRPPTPGCAGATTTRRPTFPYDELVAENGRRGQDEPEYELLDTGVFDDDRYWVVEVDYAKADPDDMCIACASPTPARTRRRCTCCRRCGSATRGRGARRRTRPRSARRRRDGDRVDHPSLGALELRRRPAPDGAAAAAAVLRQRDQRARALRRAPTAAVPEGRHQRPRRARRGRRSTRSGDGTKAAALVPADGAQPGETVELRLRLRPAQAQPAAPRRSGTAFDAVLRAAARRGRRVLRRADPGGHQPRRGAGAAAGLRRADVGQAVLPLRRRALARRRPGQPPPPPEPPARAQRAWRHIDAFDIISMPDPWEYPWFAAWDLAFHCVALAHVDPAFAKYQLLLLCREWYLHPNGALPAYEWAFGDVNPPVHAWAALRGLRDRRRPRPRVPGADLRQAAAELHLVGQPQGRRRRQPVRGRLPRPGQHRPVRPLAPARRRRLEQSDGTAWMAMYCLNLLEIAPMLGRARPRATTTWRPSSSSTSRYIADAHATTRACGTRRTASTTTCCARPTAQRAAARCARWSACCRCSRTDGARRAASRGRRAVQQAFARFARAADQRPTVVRERGQLAPASRQRRCCSAWSGRSGSLRILARCSTRRSSCRRTGCARCPRAHLDQPFTIELGGYDRTVGYEPAESTTRHVRRQLQLARAGLDPGELPGRLRRCGATPRFFGDDLTVEYPTGSGRAAPLGEIADDLGSRLISLFRAGRRRPAARATAAVDTLQNDPDWQRHLLFHEYFHGDNGAGLGATHQTGWTGLRRRPRSAAGATDDGAAQ